MHVRTRGVALQIAGGFSAIVAILVGVVVLALVQLTAMRATISHTVAIFPVNNLARDVLLQLVNQETGMRAFVASGNESLLGAYVRATPVLNADLEELQNQSADPGLRQFINSARPEIDDIQAFFSEQIVRVRRHQRAEAVRQLGGGKKLFGAYRKTAAQITEHLDALVAQESDAFHRAERLSTISMIAGSALAIIAATLIAILVGGRLSRRLVVVSKALSQLVRTDCTELTHAFTRLGRGDLTSTFLSTATSLPASGRDEITDLTASYNDLGSAFTEIGMQFAQTSGQLRELVTAVSETATSLSVSSVQVSAAVGESSTTVEQISRAIDGVADAASHQADALAQTGIASEEVTRSAVAVAKGAIEQTNSVQSAARAVDALDLELRNLADLGNHLMDAANSVASQASSGSEAATETAVALGALRDAASTAAQAMSQLEERSAAVGEIVSAIDDIADQTNLLALNAAIEAARAGEHGRGFAVVADEVRKLAERSGSSTREITGILGAIRERTTLAAQAMRQSTSAMERGIGLAERTAGALSGVGTAIGGTAQAARDVTKLVDAMRVSSEHLNENMASVSAVVDENATAAAQMRSTMQSISSTVSTMADSSAEQSASVNEVSRAAIEFTAQLVQVDGSALELRALSERLSDLVGRFIVHKEQPIAPLSTVAA